MALSLFTAPATEPISLDEAKAHCRVDTDDENGLFDNWIAAAREHVETHTRRALITQTWDSKLDAFPCDGGAIWLPFPPVSSVTSITYTATDGTSTTWSSSLYDTELPSGPKAARARIVPGYAEYYPSTRSEINAVTVRFVCGYGGAGDVPSGLKAAMLLLIGQWFRHRDEDDTTVKAAVTALLWPFRAW
jgi:uncharacterized phiE125 gp8 family phage protein